MCCHIAGRFDRSAELIGGQERREIVLAPYDPAWSRTIAAQRAALVPALAGVAARVEHVGSTSVPGLDAKPIVDVQVGVPDPRTRRR